MMKQVRRSMLLVAVGGILAGGSLTFANDDSVCVHRPYRINAPASLDMVDNFNGTARLTLDQRIDFIGNTGQKESIGHEFNEDQSLQEQFCSEYIIVAMGTADADHLTLLEGLNTPVFEKNTRFASCTFVNLLPSQERSDVVSSVMGVDNYLTERSKTLLDVQTFYDYPTFFSGRNEDNVTFPYYMIIGQDGTVLEDGKSAAELLQEMQGYCRSYDCDGVVTNTQLPNDAEIDVDNDGMENDHPEEYDIDGDNQMNGSNTERHLRGDVDGDGGKNMYDMDIDCDGIPNEQDETPYGNMPPLPECGDGEIDGPTSPHPAEQCDDGNDIDTDACTNECKHARCGDGIIQEGVEVCDDGNPNSNDGCSTTCQSESCGDGIKQNGLEQCDDGNTSDGDGCSASCTIEEEEEEFDEADPDTPDDGGGNTGGTDDNGSTDNGSTDNGSTDDAPTDSGPTDDGSTDDGSTDNGSTDDAPTDEGATDDGSTDGDDSSPPPDDGGGDEGGSEGNLPGGPNQGTVAGNSGPTTGGAGQPDRLFCASEYENCLRSCGGGTPLIPGGGGLLESPPRDINVGNLFGSFAYAQTSSNCQSEGASPSCVCTCETKLSNCRQCITADGGDEHACACKYFDHIYLNTDIPFIGQCILKRPALDGETVSATSLPNLDNAFPRFISGLSRLVQSLILVFGFVAIVVAGMMITSGGMSAEAKNKGVSILKGVIIALILLGASGIILRLINPNFFRAASMSIETLLGISTEFFNLYI